MNAESEMAGADGLGTELEPPEGCTGAVTYDAQNRPSIQHDAGTCPIHERAGTRGQRANDDGEPAYTVVGVYYEQDSAHQRYATVVYTHGGALDAEGLAQAACRNDNDEPTDVDLIEIAAVIRGEVEVVA